MHGRAALLLLVTVCAVGISPTVHGLERIGVLSPSSENLSHPNWVAFVESLKQSGYAEKRNVAFVFRYAEGRPERLPALAVDLVALRPTVIITNSTAAVAAAKNATSSIPIVFATAGNPVASGFIAGFRRPGGNITGVSSAVPGSTAGLDGKVLELIRETLPAARRIGILIHEGEPTHSRYLARVSPAAASLNFEMSNLQVGRAEDLEAVFGNIAARKLDALYVPDFSFFHTHAPRVAELALKTRIALFARPAIADETGGLMSLDINYVENWRRAGRLVARVLKGEKPAEIPVEQPERFQLTVNLKTARALGITIPRKVMLRADKVIE